MPQLNTKEQLEFAETLAELAAGGLPLVEGLRATCLDTNSRRLGRALTSLATDIEAGTAFSKPADATQQNESQPNASQPNEYLPSHIVGLLHAGAKANSLDQSLADLVDHYRLQRDLKGQLFSAMAYPAFVLACSITGLVVLTFAFVGPLRLLYDQSASMGMRQSAPHWLTQQWFWFADEGIFFLLTAVLGTLALLFAVRCFGGKALWERCLARLPIVGKMITWTGMVEFSWLLRSLLAHNVPLPKALNLMGDGLASANAAQLANWLAEGSQAGIPLSDLMAATRRIPASAVPIVRWGEQTGMLDQAMDSLYQMFYQRLQLRAALVASILVPVLLLSTGLVLLSMIVGVLWPLGEMVRSFAFFW